jgi:small-conductance mechanosensitive channel
MTKRVLLARAVLAIVAVAPLSAALLGRGVLATYLLNRCLAALVLIWAMAQLRHVVHMALRTAFDGPRAAAAAAPAAAADEDDSDAPTRMAGYWAAAAVDILIALVTLRVLLQLLDVPRAQIDYWTGLALGDIQVGNAVISLPNILLAILVLAAGLFGSSRLRRWLGKRVLPQSGMEIGLRTSIAAGAGYLGMVLAFLAAIATAGISLSSVAIVAGALSVGMGFGLRTVVENFVAGLLMLIERPIRVGDWVVIGQTEGTVRRISVRATEIETFDSASVVVPNSLFVSSPVTNWTLQNRRGRVRINLGVGYASDPKMVQAALLECARANRQVAAYPAPQALFTDFGDSALMFELRCYVRDVDNFPTVRSDLLIAIEKALRERGIEVPFPQQVVHRGQGWEETAEADLPPPVAIRPAS